MEPVTIYYCIKGAAVIAKTALSYKKAIDAKRMAYAYIQNLVDLKAINESIEDYLCLIRRDIQHLMHMHFRSAYENLQYVFKASEDNRNGYLIQARNRFIDASTIEHNENLILTYLGLALCQNLLDDFVNAERTLNMIPLVEWVDIYSSNPDKVLEDWDPEWMLILTKIAFETMTGGFPYSSPRNSHEIIDSELFNRYGYDGSALEYRKEVYHNRLNSLLKCGGFSMNEKTFSENCVRAEKLMLKDKFSEFKKSVISSFNIEK